MVYSHITELIGNTPILKIDSNVHGLKNVDLYAKLEYYNPFGSIKDRIAWAMTRDEIARLKKEGKGIVEISSGNTAKSLQLIASMYGVPFRLLTNRIKVPEIRKNLQFVGAQVDEQVDLTECPDPNALDGVFGILHDLLANEPGKYFNPDQYRNKKNVLAHFNATGPELERDLGDVDYFFGGLGTAGSTRGVAEYLLQKNPRLTTVGIVSQDDEFIPGIRSKNKLAQAGLYQERLYTDILTVAASDAAQSSIQLARQSGILAGPASGASYHAVLEYLRPRDKQLKKKATAVFIACDRAEWYMSYFEKYCPEVFGKLSERPTAHTLGAAAISEAQEIEPIALQKLRKKGVTIVDIRGAASFNLLHIPGSINLRDDTLDDLLSHSLPFSKTQPVVVVCMVGKYSKAYAALLERLGYESYSLSGGVLAWRSAGLLLEVADTRLK